MDRFASWLERTENDPRIHTKRTNLIALLLTAHRSLLTDFTNLRNLRNLRIGFTGKRNRRVTCECAESSVCLGCVCSQSFATEAPKNGVGFEILRF